ncbi:MAG: hypothetical protein DRN55_08625 [Thermoplasmata archaeon]|nr:MAG: hypothetical protein DRN55_08625 [Thermoplasmata archaeon]
MIYVQTGGERIIYLGGDKRREIEEVFDIGDLLRLIHGGYDIRVNVTDINGNWATGKTHIDSALQTLKKGLSALLDMIVAALKVIAKVASMLLEIIKKMMENILNPVISPIKSSINKLVKNAAEETIEVLGMIIYNIKYLATRTDTQNNEENSSELEDLFRTNPYIKLMNLAMLIVISISAIMTIIAAFFKIGMLGSDTAIGYALRNSLKEVALSQFLKEGAKKLALTMGGATFAILVISLLDGFLNDGGIFWRSTFGPDITSLIISFAYALGTKIAFENYVPCTVNKLLDIFGFYVSIFSIFLNLVVSAIRETHVKLARILSVIVFIASLYGWYQVMFTDDIIDWIVGGPFSLFEEVTSTVVVFMSYATIMTLW